MINNIDINEKKALKIKTIITIYGYLTILTSIPFIFVFGCLFLNTLIPHNHIISLIALKIKKLNFDKISILLLLTGITPFFILRYFLIKLGYDYTNKKLVKIDISSIKNKFVINMLMILFLIFQIIRIAINIKM